MSLTLPCNMTLRLPVPQMSVHRTDATSLILILLALPLHAGARLPAGCVADGGDAGPAGDAGTGHAANRGRDDQAGSRCSLWHPRPCDVASHLGLAGIAEAAWSSAAADGSRSLCCVAEVDAAWSMSTRRRQQLLRNTVGSESRCSTTKYHLAEPSGFMCCRGWTRQYRGHRRRQGRSDGIAQARADRTVLHRGLTLL